MSRLLWIQLSWISKAAVYSETGSTFSLGNLSDNEIRHCRHYQSTLASILVGSVLFNQILQHKVFNTTHNSNIMSLFKLLCHQAHYCPEARRPNEDKTKSMRFMWRDKDIIQMCHRCEGQINLLWTINQSRQRGRDRELITARNKRTVLLDQTELFKFDE